jgi:hypothetical protein
VTELNDFRNRVLAQSHGAFLARSKQTLSRIDPVLAEPDRERRQVVLCWR